MDLVENDVDTLYEEVEHHLVDHLVENDVNTLYEERNHIVEFNLIKDQVVDSG